MRIAALDLGTNTFINLIADVEDSRIARVYLDDVVVVRLGQGVDRAGALHPDALVRAENCLKKFRQQIDKHAVDKVVSVATSAVRGASNKKDFVQMAQKYGIPVETVSGETEAELTFLGATFDLWNSQGVAVVDIGGGSTEIICRGGSGGLVGQSLDIGSVRLTERRVTKQPILDEELENIQMDIQKQLTSLGGGPLGSQTVFVKTLIAVAGTPTTLAALTQRRSFSEDVVHGYVLKKQDIDSWISRLAAMPVAQRLTLPGMQAGREDVLVAGSMILSAVANFFSLAEVIVSTKGVRYGLALRAAKELS